MEKIVKFIIEVIAMGIFTALLFVIFAPLIVIYVLLVLTAYIPRIENTFVFDTIYEIVLWVGKFVKGFKSPYTLKKKLYFALAYLISVALWMIILFVIF